ncbi:MAG TPA: hypothetical protein VNA89_04600 [Gemmatimonadaceae bacterium]|nr:hypothetical protein [Gemmatimonadaceae bacterium]
MTLPLRVFVDGRPVDVAPGSTALDAVRVADAAAAAAVVAGARVITDSRGLPVDGGTPNAAGHIYRVVPARGAHAGDPTDA